MDVLPHKRLASAINGPIVAIGIVIVVRRRRAIAAIAYSMLSVEPSNIHLRRQWAAFQPYQVRVSAKQGGSLLRHTLPFRMQAAPWQAGCNKLSFWYP